MAVSASRVGAELLLPAGTTTAVVVPADARLWNDLLARLALAQQASLQPQAWQLLRSLGVRRPGTTTLNLLRERAAAERMAVVAGLRLQPRELHLRIGELAYPAPLPRHLQALADAYQRLAEHPSASARPDLLLWMCERQRMHRQQLAGFMDGAGCTAP
jgi:thymidylate synthase ThyX